LVEAATVAIAAAVTKLSAADSAVIVSKNSLARTSRTTALKVTSL
jgi:hypothetical protein